GQEPPKVDFLDERVAIPAKPANGVQLVMPEETLAAGGDKMFCWVGDYSAPQDELIVQADGLQGKAGHHIFIFTSVIPRKAGDVFDCTSNESMATLEPLM